jgi:aspartyl/asparaginyl beta-hydroxylase (cupin superfamily)/Tfp pilus assembly protein PilF
LQKVVAQAHAQEIIGRATQARRAGDIKGAKRLLQDLLAADPGCVPALNSLGLLALAENDVTGASDLLRRASQLDPAAPPVWLNLAEARRAAGDVDGEIAALDRALAIDPYMFAALFKKGQALERSGRLAESAKPYRAILSITANATNLPEPVQQALAHARQVVNRVGDASFEARAAALEEASSLFPDADLSRARIYAEQLSGRRNVYTQQPTGGHFPFLPAIEFFDRTLFPWLETLEAATDQIRRELLSLWNEGNDGFRPYVTFDETQPVNQWAELNHSPRWSAWFLWKDGVRQDQNCVRCPATAAALEMVPLLDIPGKAPSVMFSILQPRTRIPPHTGFSNVRSTVHLPLVVPEGCGFRVGGETREWRPGQAWAFDDTIEHEAWNDSDKPRAILILDVWNPLLTGPEQVAIRSLG